MPFGSKCAYLPIVIGTAMLGGACQLLLAENPDFAGDSSSESGPEPLADLPPACSDCPDPLVFDDLADTYTDELAPEQAFGVEQTLRVDDDKDTYIRLPSLASAEGKLERLTLILHCTKAQGTIWVLSVGEDWDEATLSAATESSLATWHMLLFQPQVGENVIELADRLAPWQLEQASPSIKLRSLLLDDVLECSSREGSVAPRVEMTLAQ